jgi:hypothetical protein
VGPEFARCAHYYYAPLSICRTALLQLRQRRGAAGNGLGTTIEYLRQTTSGAAGNGLGTTTKLLRRATSGATDKGLSRCRGFLMCPFTTSALHSPFFVRASVAYKHNSTAEVRGLRGLCAWGPRSLTVLINLLKLSCWHLTFFFFFFN